MNITFHSKQLENIYVPIAGSSVFPDYWLLICEKLHLTWIPQFQNWLYITQIENISAILEELVDLNQFLAVNTDFDIPDLPLTIDLLSH